MTLPVTLFPPQNCDFTCDFIVVPRSDSAVCLQAKKFVESAPQVVQGELQKEEAEKLKEAIEAAGGTTEIE